MIKNRKLYNAIRIYDKQIGMEFGIKKCTMLLKKGRKKQITKE